MNQITRGVMRPSIFGTCENHLRAVEKNTGFSRHDRTVGLPGKINEYNTALIQSLEGGEQRIYRRIFLELCNISEYFLSVKPQIILQLVPTDGTVCRIFSSWNLLLKFTTVRELKACLWPILSTDLWFMKHCRKTHFMSCFHVWCALRCSKNIHGF